MVRYLSDAWLEAVQRAAERSGPSPAGDGERVRLVLRQVVVGGPDGDVTYRVTVDGGTVRVDAGDGPSDLTLSEDYDTAVALHRGELSAPVAFMTGKVRVSGNLGALLAGQDALRGIQVAFDDVRDITEYPAARASSEPPTGGA